MANPSQGEAQAAFRKTFRDIARHKHRYDVFRDFVTLAACSLHNALLKEESREQEYLQIIGGYNAPDQQAFPKLLGQLVQILEAEPRDVLGPLYMELEIASKDQGQFFTPPELSELMARMNFGDQLVALKDKPFITLAEPACGAGGMVLACVKVMLAHGMNPAERLWVQCIDVDRTAALMCYIQLTLWNVPAEVIVGNTLSWELREVWYTPAHHQGSFPHKLRCRAEEDDPGASDTPDTPDPDIRLDVPAPETPAEPAKPEYEISLLDWHGQALTVRWCPSWGTGDTAHLEIVTDDRRPHPISETGYRSHFIPCGVVEEAGGPVAYVTAWLHRVDDGAPRQLSLF